MNSGFTWVKPPEEELIPNLDAYGKKVLVAIQAVANYWGQLNQDDARLSAPWTDRSGAARGGLFFAVDGFGLKPITGTVTAEATGLRSDITIESGDANTLIIALGHTVYYGKFLETKNGGKYAVIMSTIESNLPRLEQMLKDLLRG